MKKMKCCEYGPRFLINRPFNEVFCKTQMILNQVPGASTVKHYGLVIYTKWTNFVVSLCLFYCWLVSYTIAYYCKLRIRNFL
jgi:hypothetical protein